jgi:hypothetical protein
MDRHFWIINIKRYQDLSIKLQKIKEFYQKRLFNLVKNHFNVIILKFINCLSYKPSELLFICSFNFNIFLLVIYFNLIIIIISLKKKIIIINFKNIFITKIISLLPNLNHVLNLYLISRILKFYLYFNLLQL